MSYTPRLVFLDLETTGISRSEGHRIIEIAAIEMVDRQYTGNEFHVYVDPQRDVPEDAVAIHGITTEMLKGKPLFSEVSRELMEFLSGTCVISHNARFETKFINYELEKAGQAMTIDNYCAVFDTLQMARKLHPERRNDLTSLCKRYKVDVSGRTLHGALLDTKLLGDVFLLMTKDQPDLYLQYQFV